MTAGTMAFPETQTEKKMTAGIGHGLDAAVLAGLPEGLRAAVEGGHAPARVVEAVRAGQDGRGPRTSKPAVNVREYVASL